MNNKIVIGIAALGIAAVAYGTLSPASNAQAPAGETTEQKIARLEKEVSDLRKEVTRLKRFANVVTIPAPAPRVGRVVPTPPGKPFGFNGQTYYYVPLSDAAGSESRAIPGTTLKIAPLSSASK